MISSAMPSPKYSFSLSELRFSNGSTAIDCFGADVFAAAGFASTSRSAASSSAAVW